MTRGVLVAMMVGAASGFGLVPLSSSRSTMTLRRADAIEGGVMMPGRTRAMEAETKKTDVSYSTNILASVLLSSLLLNAVVTNAPKTPIVPRGGGFNSPAKIEKRRYDVKTYLSQRAAESKKSPAKTQLTLPSLDLPTLPTFPAQQQKTAAISPSEEAAGIAAGALAFLALPGIILSKIRDAFVRAEKRKSFLK